MPDEPINQQWQTRPGFPPLPDQEWEYFTPPPSPEFQKATKSYVGRFCRDSAEYVKQKTAVLDLFARLFRSQISLQDWTDLSPNRIDASQSRVSEDYRPDEQSHLADYVHPCSPYITAHVQNIFAQVFEGPEWLNVLNEDEAGRPITDKDVPMAVKIGELVRAKLTKGGIERSAITALLDLCLFGTCCLQVNWHRKYVSRFRRNVVTGEIARPELPIWEVPVLSTVPLNQWLPDPEANNSDCQQWRGIGHRLVMPFHEVLAGFSRGYYDLNQEEFGKRFGGGRRGWGQSDPEGLAHDPDADSITSESATVKAWVWHGAIPFYDGLIEGYCTIITEPDSDDPTDGVLVRVGQEPFTVLGDRPYVVGHYSEMPGPYGLGIMHKIHDPLFAASQFMAMIMDVGRRTANAGYMCRRGSAVHEELRDNNRLFPGRILTFDEKDDLFPTPSPNNDIAVQQQLVAAINETMERVTGATNTFMGLASGGRQTATEINTLQQQGAVPANVQARLFVTNVLNPACNLALALIQEHTLTDSVVMIKDSNGFDQPLAVTAEELRSGRWKVVCSLTAQDSMGVAKAQVLERILQEGMSLNQAFQMEGKWFSSSEVMGRILNYLRTEGADRILRTVTPNDPVMLMQENMALKQQLAQLTQPQQGQGAPQGQQSGPPPEPPQPPMAENGGPMGPAPTDPNIMAQMLQMQASQQLGGQQ